MLRSLSVDDIHDQILFDLNSTEEHSPSGDDVQSSAEDASPDFPTFAHK